MGHTRAARARDRPAFRIAKVLDRAKKVPANLAGARVGRGRSHQGGDGVGGPRHCGRARAARSRSNPPAAKADCERRRRGRRADFDERSQLPAMSLTAHAARIRPPNLTKGMVRRVGSISRGRCARDREKHNDWCSAARFLGGWPSTCSKSAGLSDLRRERTASCGLRDDVRVGQRFCKASWQER